MKFVLLAIFALTALSLTSCSVVTNRIEDAKEIPQASLVGTKAYDFSTSKAELLGMWAEEYSKVQQMKRKKMALFPRVKQLIKDKFQNYVKSAEFRKANPLATKADVDAYLQSEHFNAAASEAVDLVVQSKEFKAQNTDALYYLLGQEAAEQAISITQIGIHWNYLPNDHFETIVTTNTVDDGMGNTLTTINTENKLTLNVNLLDDLMREIDPDVSYLSLRQRLDEDEITAFSAFVRFFSENESMPLPLIGAGQSDRGQKHKILAALWAALRATQIPVTPDGRLLSPPNGLRIVPIIDDTLCTPAGNRTRGGTLFYQCRLQVQTAEGYIVDQNLRVKTRKVTKDIDGFATSEGNYGEYFRSKYPSAQEALGVTPVQFEPSSEGLVDASDLAYSTKQVIKNFVAQGVSDGWDLIKGAGITAGRGMVVGQALGEVWPQMSGAEGRALGGAVNIIAYFYNRWIAKERLPEQQIAQLAALVQEFSASVDSDGVIMDKEPARWTIIPSSQVLPADASGKTFVDGGVRLATAEGMTDSSGDLVFKVVPTDVGGDHFEESMGIKSIAGGGMAAPNANPHGLADDMGAATKSLQEKGLVARFMPLPNKAARETRAFTQLMGLSADELGSTDEKITRKQLKALVENKARIETMLTPSNNPDALFAYLKKATALVMSGKSKEAKAQGFSELFEKEFGLALENVDLANAANLDEGTLAIMAEHSEAFKSRKMENASGEMIQLATNVEGLRSYLQTASPAKFQQALGATESSVKAYMSAKK